MKKDIQYFQAGFKAIPVEDAKSVSPKEASVGTIIKGFASTPTLDRYDDIVDPEAFRNSIVKNYRKNPIILFQHNPDRPIGKATALSIDGRGLYIEALIVDGEVEPKIHAGILKAFSIGFIPKRIEYQDEEGMTLNPSIPEERAKIINGNGIKRIIKEVDLVENSVVSVPANPDALFTMEKSLKSFFDKEVDQLSKTFDNANDELECNKEHADSLTKHTMDNLLESKEAEEVETPAAEEAPEVPAEEVEAPEGDETPADETSGEEDGDEKSAEVAEEAEATEEVAEEVSEEPEAEAAEEAEEEVPAEEEAVEEGEKTAPAVESKLLTQENFEMLVKEVATLRTKNAELEKMLASTPAKEALAYSEQQKYSNTTDSEAKEAAKAAEEKTGFKDLLIKNML